MSKSHFIIPIFVPHRGCPHDCIFCNQKKITGQTDEMTAEEAEKIIEEHLKIINYVDNHVEIAFFGGSFTAIPIEQQSSLLEIAYKYKQSGQVGDIRLSTRPDCIDEAILMNLKKYGVTVVELGVQSMNEEVLNYSNRGHAGSDVVHAVELLQKFKFKVGVQVMVGLPKDNFSRSLETVKALIALKPDFTRIYPALIIKDTYMELMYQRGEYTPLPLEECVKWCARLLMLFEYHGIQVIRVGLQATENIKVGRDLISGPFHPSMRQLVESDIYLSMIKYLIESEEVCGQDMTITVNPLDISYVIGQKRKNSIYIKQYYSVKSLKIVQELSMDRESIKINWDNRGTLMSKKQFISLNVIKGFENFL